MARKIKSAFRRALKGLLTVLGLSSIITACGEGGPFGGSVAMYGTPENHFTLEGKVTDSSGTPVKGIQVGVEVQVEDGFWYPDGSEPSDDEVSETLPVRYTVTYYNGKPVLSETDSDGKYKLEWTMNNGFKFVLSALDIDGEENGSFDDTFVDVEFTNDTKVKSGDWKDYYEIKGKNITLDSSESVK